MKRALTTWTLSEAVALMLRPSREYQWRVGQSRTAPWPRALIVPGLLTLLFGIVTSAAATGRVVASLVVSQTICWTFVPVLQFVTGSGLIGASPNRLVTFPRAIELLFAAHGPWSLWLVAIGVAQMLTPNQNVVILSAAVPGIWTAWILLAFSHDVLGLPAGRGRLAVFLHQAATVLLILAYVEFASRLSVRAIGQLAR